MNKYFIKKYIDKLTKQDIMNYATSKEIYLSKEEIDIIYNTIKTKWIDFINGNQSQILEELKPHISQKSYQEIINIYTKYKNKI